MLTAIFTRRGNEGIVKTQRPGVLLATALLVTMLHTTSVAAQVDQRALAQQLLGADVEAHHRALVAVESIGAQNASPELRVALITLLERQNKIVAEARRRKVPVATLQGPEFIIRVARVVAEMKDPQAIPALADALDAGSTAVTTALAEFGEPAAPAVLAVVMSPHSADYAVDEGLIALRFMVEEAGTHPLSAGTLEEIRRAAEHYLTVPGRLASIGGMLRLAIDLTVALNDPGLRRIVEALASDPNEVMARGVTDPRTIAEIQKLAADRLAGVPPVPPPPSRRPPRP